jgi:hypothetical protein
MTFTWIDIIFAIVWLVFALWALKYYIFCWRKSSTAFTAFLKICLPLLLFIDEAWPRESYMDRFRMGNELVVLLLLMSVLAWIGPVIAT